MYNQSRLFGSNIIAALIHWMRVRQLLFMDSNSRIINGSDYTVCQAHCEPDPGCRGFVMNFHGLQCLLTTIDPDHPSVYFWPREDGDYYYKCVFGELGKPGKFGKAVVLHLKH